MVYSERVEGRDGEDVLLNVRLVACVTEATYDVSIMGSYYLDVV
jgi:hypothetical protein